MKAKKDSRWEKREVRYTPRATKRIEREPSPFADDPTFMNMTLLALQRVVTWVNLNVKESKKKPAELRYWSQPSNEPTSLSWGRPKQFVKRARGWLYFIQESVRMCKPLKSQLQVAARLCATAVTVVNRLTDGQTQLANSMTVGSAYAWAPLECTRGTRRWGTGIDLRKRNAHDAQLFFN